MAGTDISSTLTNSLRVQYVEDYIRGGMRRRLYDQVAQPIDERSEAARQAASMAQLSRAGTVQVVFLSDMQIGTTSLSEVADITPQTLRDQTATVTTDMYGEAIQVSQKGMIMRYTNYGAEKARKVGMNMMESVDYLAQKAALQGSWVKRNDTRGKLDAGTAGDRANNDHFRWAAARFSTFVVPGWEDDSGITWACITDPFVVGDIATGGDIVNVAQYQRAEIILQHEIGRLDQFRIVESGLAKIFYGGGTTNASDVDTTLSAAANALSTTIVVASATNIAQGDWLNIGTKETGNTFYPHNERVNVASVSGTTITIVGQADNGGLRFDHASGATVNADDSVHTMLFGGPASLAKVYSPDIGEFGEMVGPLFQGMAQQWTSLSWKHYGGYGRLSENWLQRSEVSVEEEA